MFKLISLLIVFLAIGLTFQKDSLSRLTIIEVSEGPVSSSPPTPEPVSGEPTSSDVNSESPITLIEYITKPNHISTDKPDHNGQNDHGNHENKHHRGLLDKKHLKKIEHLSEKVAEKIAFLEEKANTDHFKAIVEDNIEITYSIGKIRDLLINLIDKSGIETQVKPITGLLMQEFEKLFPSGSDIYDYLKLAEEVNMEQKDKREKILEFSHEQIMNYLEGLENKPHHYKHLCKIVKEALKHYEMMLERSFRKKTSPVIKGLKEYVNYINPLVKAFNDTLVPHGEETRQAIMTEVEQISNAFFETIQKMISSNMKYFESYRVHLNKELHSVIYDDFKYKIIEIISEIKPHKHHQKHHNQHDNQHNQHDNQHN